MELHDLIQRFSGTAEDQKKAIFSTLFIAGNQLQTLFDERIPQVSLKQFMLLSVARQAREPMTFTQLGALLGCSRQNIKKLAEALERKGFVTVRRSPRDRRGLCVCPTEKAEAFFQNEFALYQKELNYLFEVYTEAEVETLFTLLTRLYEGIQRLEEKTSHENSSDL